MKIFKENGRMPTYLIFCYDYSYDYSTGYNQYFLLYKGEEVQTTRAIGYLEAWQYFDYTSETKDVLFV